MQTRQAREHASTPSTTFSRLGILRNTSVHPCKRLVSAFFELRASIGHAQYSVGMFSCTCLVVQRHELDICSFRHLRFYLLDQIGNAQKLTHMSTSCPLSSAIVNSPTIASNFLKKT